MNEFAICKLDGPFVSKRLRGEVIGKCNVRFISPAQAALRAMTDGEVALILLRRSAQGCWSGEDVPNLDDSAVIATAAKVGLWPPEVRKDG